MGTRRENNEGSIVKVAEDKYRARVSVNGRRPSQYLPSEDAAKAWIQDTLALSRLGVNVAPDRTTVADLGAGWLAARQISVSPNTYVKYETNYRCHIKKDIGDTPIRKLLAQTYINEKSQQVASATVRIIWSILRSILEDAVELGIITKLPKIRLPKLVERIPDPINAEQISYLLNASITSKYGFGLWVELGTGLRRSELLALNWSDYDSKTKTLRVNKALVRVGNKNIIKETKTDAGNRVMDLPALVCEILDKQPKQTGKMFATESGTYLTGWNWARLFKSWVEHANKAIIKENADRKKKKKKLPPIPKLAGVRFHDLRHQFASHLLSLGIHPRVAQQMTGHSDMPTLMQRYSHVTPDATRDAADDLDGLMQGFKKKPEDPPPPS